MRKPIRVPRKPQKVKPSVDPQLKRILDLLVKYEQWFGLIFFALGIPTRKGGPINSGRGQRGTETNNGNLEKPRPRRIRPGGIL